MRYECPFIGGPSDGDVELLPVNIGDELPAQFDCEGGHYLLDSVVHDGRPEPIYRFVADDDLRRAD